MNNRVHVSGHAAEVPYDLICVAEWLAQLFLTPFDAERVAAARTKQGQAALRSIGETLNQPEAAEQFCLELCSGEIPETVTRLQRRHSALFDGVFRDSGALPYASAWDGTGRLFGAAVSRTQALLDALDVHIPQGCAEPADHLSVQLAGLAEALRQKNAALTGAMLAELDAWADRFADQILETDNGRLYGVAAQFLIALLEHVQIYHSCELNREHTASVALT
ncbi:MAG: hypothetical protein GX772_02105 [Alcaligenaceae bacterium]|nr:hypothetical protein [Alcaligenaceae bacterium]